MSLRGSRSLRYIRLVPLFDWTDFDRTEFDWTDFDVTRISIGRISIWRISIGLILTGQLLIGLILTRQLSIWLIHHLAVVPFCFGGTCRPTRRFW